MQNWESGISNALRALNVESIRRKIVVFAAVATLIPSVSTAVLSYVYNRRALTQKVTETLRSTSSQGAREVDLWMKERTYDVRVFASSYEVSENVDRLRRGGRMQLVGLHQPGVEGHACEQKRHQRHLVPARQRRIYLRKFVGIGQSVVRRHQNADQQHLGAGPP